MTELRTVSLSMASSISNLSEEQGRCTFCSDEAKHYCRTCKESLCVKCQEVHKKSSKTNTNHHHVVPFSSRKESLRSLVPDMCAIHHGSKYESGCLTCQVAVCKKCLSTLHNGHKKCDLSGFLDSIMETLKDEFAYLQNSLLPRYHMALNYEDSPPYYASTTSEIKRNMTKETRQICDLLNFLLLEGHQAVDDAVLQDQEISRIQKQRNQNHLMRLEQLEHKYKEFFAAIDKNVLIDFLNDRQDFRDMLYPPYVREVVSPQYHPCNINLAVLRSHFASVASSNQSSLIDVRLRHFNKRLMAEPVRITSFVAGKNHLLYQVKCYGNDGAWILTGDSLLYYNRAGKKIDSLDTSDGQNGNPAGIAVTTEQNEVIYTMSNCIVSVKSGRKPQILTSTDDWVPNGVCLTTCGEILVTLQKAEAGKVVKYNESQVTLTIQYDELGHPIYSMPWYITENRITNDICVSDTDKNLVIVVNETGKLRFKFDAPYRHFQPRDICVNSQGHILVADPYNNNINILDMDGVFLLNINTRALEILLPQAISIDAEENLWIGGRDTRRVALIRYIHDI